MKPFLTALAGLSMVVGVSAAFPASADSDEDTCRRWGTVPGTPAYFDCRGSLERQRAGGAAPSPKQQVIGEGLATNICDKRVRETARYRILKEATSSNVSGGFEKRVSISYQIEKPGAALAFMSAECMLRGDQLVDIKMNQ